MLDHFISFIIVSYCVVLCPIISYCFISYHIVFHFYSAASHHIMRLSFFSSCIVSFCILLYRRGSHWGFCFFLFFASYLKNHLVYRWSTGVQGPVSDCRVQPPTITPPPPCLTVCLRCFCWTAWFCSLVSSVQFVQMMFCGPRWWIISEAFPDWCSFSNYDYVSFFTSVWRSGIVISSSTFMNVTDAAWTSLLLHQAAAASRQDAAFIYYLHPLTRRSDLMEPR